MNFILPVKVYGLVSEAYCEPCQTSKMEHFTKIARDFQPLNIVAKDPILDAS